MLVVAVVSCVPARAQVPRRAALSLDACVVLLLDPRAGSHQKLDACATLASMGRGALPAAEALARQSLYDMEPVRDLAYVTLVDLVGQQETERLRKMAAVAEGGNPRKLAESMLESVKTWDDFPRAAVFLGMQSPELRRLGALAAVRIWDTTGKLPTDMNRLFVNDARGSLLGALSDTLPAMTPAQRKSAVALGIAVDAAHADAAPLLFVALADPDAAVRAQAKPAADQLFRPDQTNVRALRTLAAAAQGGGPTTGSTAAQEYIRNLEPPGTHIVGRILAHRVAIGWDPLEQAIRAVGAIPHIRAATSIAKEAVIEHRNRLAAVIDPDLDPTAVRLALFRLLMDADAVLGEKAARLALADPMTFDPPALLDAAIAVQADPAFPALRVLATADLPADAAAARAPAVGAAAARLRPWLRFGTAGQAMAALQLAAVIEPTGETVVATLGPELNRLLETENENLRLTAARLLGRYDVITHARIPHLLADLRSDHHSTRALAARQFDEMGLEPRAVTAALVRAVDRRDLAARVGLTEALAAAHAQRRAALDVLKERAARSDPANAAARAYARAALREVEAAK
jgi:hypothetical protein